MDMKTIIAEDFHHILRNKGETTAWYENLRRKCHEEVNSNETFIDHCKNCLCNWEDQN